MLSLRLYELWNICVYEREAASARRCARVKSAIGLSLQALGIERVISIGKCEEERNCESLSERTGEGGGRREEKRERATGSVAFAGSWVIPTAHNLANVFPLFFLSLFFSFSLSFYFLPIFQFYCQKPHIWARTHESNFRALWSLGECANALGQVDRSEKGTASKVCANSPCWALLVYTDIENEKSRVTVSLSVSQTCAILSRVCYNL